MVVLSVLVLGLFGLALLGGGIYLVVLGGSAYYLLAGGGIAITALLLNRRSAHALTVFAAVLFGTLVWALWEVGFDWWQLARRGGLLVLLGLWLLLPFVRRKLNRAPVSSNLSSLPAQVLVGACVLSVVVIGWSILADPHDRQGRLPDEKGTTAVGNKDHVLGLLRLIDYCRSTT